MSTHIQKVENISEEDWENIFQILEKMRDPNCLAISKRLKELRNKPTLGRELTKKNVSWIGINAKLATHGSKFRIYAPWRPDVRRPSSHILDRHLCFGISSKSA